MKKEMHVTENQKDRLVIATPTLQILNCVLLIALLLE